MNIDSTISGAASVSPPNSPQRARSNRSLYWILLDLRNGIDRLMHRSGTSLLTDSAMPADADASDFDDPWEPAAEIVERNGTVTVRVELPGVKKEDIHLEIIANELVVSGERTDGHDARYEEYFRSERSYGRFERRLLLPIGTDTDTASATLTDGVLEIVVATRATARSPRTVDIR